MQCPVSLLVLLTACWSAAPLHTTATSGATEPFRVHTAQIRGGVRGIATNGVHVVVLSHADQLIGFTADGARTFSRQLPKAEGLELAGDVAVVTTKATVIGVSIANGRTRWLHPIDPDVRTSVVGDQVWLESEGEPQTLSARWGHEVPRRMPAPRGVTATYEGERVRLLAATWTLELEPARAQNSTHVDLGDAIMISRVHGDASTIVALDAATGRTRWTYDLPADYLFRAAFRGPGVYWVMLTDVGAVINGSEGFRWLALAAADGKLLRRVDAPDPDASRCGGDTKWSSAGGVLAISHATVSPKGCGPEVLSILAPAR